MASANFDATWIPRIGERGAVELRRGRRIALTVAVVVPALAVAAGVLFAVGGLGNLLGAVLMVVVAGCCAMFVQAQMRLAAAMSEWFGVKIRGGQIPKMNPKRFDVWCEARDLHSPPRQGAVAQEAQPTDMTPRRS
jgi:hypothetical protein